VRERIDQHLDALDVVLRASGGTRAQRQDVLDNVHSHFAEKLLERCGTREPTRDDAHAVLATMDPPSSFATNEPDGPQGCSEQPVAAPDKAPRPRRHSWASPA
jgi:hypothetical protein